MAGSKLPHWKRVALYRFMQIKDHPDFDEDIQIIRSIFRPPADKRPTLAELLSQAARRGSYLESNDYLVNVNLERMIQKYEAPRGVFVLLKAYMAMLGEAEDAKTKSISKSNLESWLAIAPDVPPISLVSTTDETMAIGGSSRNTEASGPAYQALKKSDSAKRVYLELTPDVQQEDLIDYIKMYYKNIEAKLELLDPDRVRRTPSGQLLKRDYKIISLYKTLSRNTEYRGRIYKEIQSRTKVNEETIKAVIKHYRRQCKQWGMLLA